MPEAPRDLPGGVDFIRARVAEDRAAGRYDGRVVTRFPPEPNGFLHIGHAKSICLNFGVAAEHGGVCHLRFDDTNPTTEEERYVQSIQRDVRWLGFDWGRHCYHASDYFEQLYAYGCELVRRGKAYVCDLSPEQVAEYRGVWNQPGRESPWRGRPAAESLDLLRRMRAGEFEEGSRTLRAKIDMSSSNMNLRDPILYRIQKRSHHRTGDAWCLYPTYDFAHPLSDSIERITHSLCTLEFEDHRPLYDWLCEALGVYHPQQIEFARLNLTYTLMSKRRLLQLVEEGHVSGWDDPRMPTLSGLRRRGFTPESVRDFCARIGVAKAHGFVEMELLEHCLREDQNRRAPRAMAVLDPLRVVIENYPEGRVEWMPAVNNPEDPSMGTREVPFARELFIEREDFREDPPKKFHRLAPGREVRLRYAYLITCTGVLRDESGALVGLRCTYDPATRGGDAPDGRKVRGTLHWVSAAHALPAEVRLYDRLFRDPVPDFEGAGLAELLNPGSLVTLSGCRVEPSLAEPVHGGRYQFERQGYFCVDELESTPEKLVFNRSVALRDSWAKAEQKAQD
jgi:glutaminyl-tRNA synthetase